MFINKYMKNIIKLFIVIALFYSCDSREVEIQYFDHYDTITNIQKRISIVEILTINQILEIPRYNIIIKIESDDQIKMKRVVYDFYEFPNGFFDNLIIYKDDDENIKTQKRINQRIIIYKILNNE